MKVYNLDTESREKARQRRIREKIQEFTLMDDDFMTRFFEDELDCTSFILQVILEKPDLRAVSSVCQSGIKNLVGRSVRLDIRAEDSDGRIYDIEIQRSDAGAGARRARYNSALIDANESLPGRDTAELPETYVIFITENDVFGRGLPLYHIDRTIAETGAAFGDGAHIIYVNNKYRGNDPVGDLMHDFSCRNAADMKSRLLAERTRYFKGEIEDGGRKMSRIMDELIAEERTEQNMEIALRMLGRGKVSEDELADLFDLSQEQAEEVAARFRRGQTAPAR